MVIRQRQGARSILEMDSLYFTLCIFLSLSAIGVRLLCLPFQSADASRYLIPWFNYLIEHGRIRALADDFYDYAPAYIYLLDLASLFRHAFHALTLSKLVTFIFEIFASVFIFRLAEIACNDRRRALLSSLLFLNLPTVILNGSLWGQCDIIYTTFLLGFVYFIIQSRPFSATAMYGLALSFKLQAIFLAPFVIFLVLKKRIPVTTLLIVPAVYVAIALPAALAGRPLWELLSVYLRQTAENSGYLSLGAPNIDHLIEGYIAPDMVPSVVRLNLAFAGALSIAFFAAQMRSGRGLQGVQILLGATFWLAVEPMILPRMHERYFFPADVLSFVLAIWMPQRWWIAALFQLGSILAYSTFLTVSAGLAPELHLLQAMRGSYVASVLVIVGTASVTLLLWGRRKQQVGH
jgi:Gpi18-like mannosyltransferase